MALHSDLSDDVLFSLTWWGERLAERCYVYVIQEQDDDAIKVGTAQDPMKRLATLQTGNRRKLHLRYVIPGSHDTEAHFHRRLKENRVHGEWFHGRLVEPFLDYIEDVDRRMMAAYVKGSGVAPHIFDVDPLRYGKVRKPPTSNPVEVRWVEPNPTMDPAEAQRRRGVGRLVA